MESFGFLSDWVVVWTFLERKSTSYTRSKNRSYCFELLWFYLEIRMVKMNGTSENKSSAVPLEGVHSHPDSLTASFSVERKKERKKENTSDISIARRLQHSQPPRLHRPIVSHTNTASVSTCLLPLSRVTLIMVAIRKPIQWMALTVSWALTQSQTPVTTHHVISGLLVLSVLYYKSIRVDNIHLSKRMKTSEIMKKWETKAHYHRRIKLFVLFTSFAHYIVWNINPQVEINQSI